MNCYLKANIDRINTYYNFGHWINVFLSMKDIKIYLLCDNGVVIDKIRQIFPNIDEIMDVIPSLRDEPLIRNLADRVLSDRWKNTGCAHLTTFLHNREHGNGDFWNIDADDTFIAASPEHISEMLEKVRSIAKKRDISIFSLDMHASRLAGMHWSFGITYTDGSKDWFEIMDQYADLYHEMKSELGKCSNLDWFFTFLRAKSGLNIDSFYVEDMRFVHGECNIYNLMYSGVYYWENGRLHSPILKAFGADILENIPIASGLVKIYSSITKEESLEYLQDYVFIKEIVQKETSNIEDELCEKVKPFLKKTSEKKLEDVVTIENGELKIRSFKLREGVTYILCPYGIGDLMYVSGFVNAYRKVHPELKIGFIVQEHQLPVLSWFKGNIDSEIIASTSLVKVLDYYAVTNGIIHLKNFFYGHFKKDSKFNLLPEYFEIAEKKILNRYSKLIFGLEDTSGFEAPIIPKLDNKDAEDLIIDERSVIIAPYAKSSSLLPEEFWEILSETLKKLGLRVWTNVSNGEKVIKGTEALSIDLAHIAGICSRARAVISIRSGLCDVLAFTDTSLYVINMTEVHYTQWDLNCVVKREGIINLLCDSKKKMPEVAQTIVERICLAG